MSIEERIQAELSRLEKEKEITILLAIESGSRAWGFPSPDSDYDVRFLYAHPTNWYLSVRERRDVIELPIDDVLDISGWELRKAFRLMLQSNGALYEWMSSPIVYRVNERAIAPLKTLAPQVFNPEAMFYHYLAMAKHKTHEICNTEQAKLKTYLYALRPLLCCQWIMKFRKAPPMEFSLLMDEFIPVGTELREALELLLREKAATVESQKRDRLPMLDDYLGEELSTLESGMGKYHRDADLDEVDAAFRETLSLLTSEAV